MINFIKRLFRLDGDDLISQDQFEKNLIKLVTKLGSSLSNIIPYIYRGRGIYNIANEYILIYREGYIELFDITIGSYPWTIKEDYIVFDGNNKVRCTRSYQVDTFRQWRSFKSDLLRGVVKTISYKEKRFIEDWNYVFWRLNRNPYISEEIKVDYSSGSNSFTYIDLYMNTYNVIIKIIRSGIMSSTYLVTVKKDNITICKRYLSKSSGKITIDEFLCKLDKGEKIESELHQVF